MPSIKQLPAQLDWEFVAGAPASITVTATGATITSPTVTLKSATGATITGTVPTVSQVGAVTTVAFSSSTTAALNTDLTRPVSLLWSLSALVDGQGPFHLVARRLTICPVGTAGTSSTSSATLAVTVGSSDISLTVATGWSPDSINVTPSGDTTGARDTAAISAAMDAANTAGKSVFMNAGTFYLNGQILKSYPIKIWAVPGTVTVTRTTDNWAFRSSGSLGSQVALTADAAQGATVISCNTTSFAAGDIVLVGDTTATWSTGQPTQYQGHQTRVKRVLTASTLELEDGLYAPFTTAASAFVAKVTSVAGVMIRGIKFDCNLAPASNSSGHVWLRYCSDVDVDVEGTRHGHAGVRLHHVLDGRARVKMYRGYDFEDPDGTGIASQFGYGIEVGGACSNILADVHVRRVRHATVMGGVAGEYGEPINVRISGVAVGCSGTSWDVHSAGRNVVFANCMSFGSRSAGFNIRGRNTYIYGGLSSGDGWGVDVFENGFDSRIEGLVVTNTVSGPGVRIYQGISSVRIDNCFFDGIATSGVKFEESTNFTDIHITGNKFRRIGTLGTAGDRSAVNVGSTGTVLARIERNLVEDAGTIQFFIDATGAAMTGTTSYYNELSGITEVGGTNASTVIRRTFRPDVVRSWGPSTAIAETFASGRLQRTESIAQLTSGTLQLHGGIVLPARVPVNSITFVSAGTGAVTPTNQWFALVATDGTILAMTVDNTTTAWGTNTARTLNLSATYTPTVDTPVWLAICVVAATPPNLAGQSVQSAVASIAPMVAATANTGLTTPASFTSLDAQTVHTGLAYAYVS
jgi:hypothetical protein